MTEYTTTSDHHTVRAFDSDLQGIADKVAAMGGLAERQITDAVRALVDRDTGLAERVIATDSTLDAMQQEIQQMVERTVALRQPVAVDLREVVAARVLCDHIERIGDYASHIGKRTIALGADQCPQALVRGVAHMADQVLSSLKQVLGAYASRNVQAALAVWKGDEEVDAQCASLYRGLLSSMMEDSRNITACMHLMFCAKEIERIGDHVANIAQMVHYMIEGRAIAGLRPKGDTTNFASEHS